MLRQMLKKKLHKICIKHEITEQFWSATLTFLFLYFYKNSSYSTSKIKTFINSIAEPNALWWGIWRWQGHSRTLNISRSSWQRLMIQELLGVLNKCSLPIVQFNSFRRWNGYRYEYNMNARDILKAMGPISSYTLNVIEKWACNSVWQINIFSERPST